MTSEISKFSSIHYRIQEELAIAIQNYKKDHEMNLMTVLGSWGDTLSDQDILDLLISHNTNI